MEPPNSTEVNKLQNKFSNLTVSDCTLMPVAQPFNNTWYISWHPKISVSKILRESYMKGKSTGNFRELKTMIFKFKNVTLAGLAFFKLPSKLGFSNSRRFLVNKALEYKRSKQHSSR